MALVFEPGTLSMLPLDEQWRRCANGVDHDICNWAVPAMSADRYCRACALNELIPNLEVPGNLEMWARLESAKRRLLYNLLSLDLQPDDPAARPRLRFRFMQDQRSNPAVIEPFVGTGHHDGAITINLREADDVQRTAERQATLERYRTLLGHFRHESGHYYFERLDAAADQLRWRELFGDERQDYAAAMATYYRNGPPVDWWQNYLSAYASAHPYEDWAESFAHYLHIVDALETGHQAGLAELPADGRPGWIREWMRLSVTLNELNRSLGTDDPYPFVLTDRVIQKLEFIDRLVHRPGG